MKKYFKNIPIVIKDINIADAIIHAVFSTADEDRSGEIVDQKSWILDSFMTNPVVLWAHNHDEPAIGKINSLGYNADGNLEGEVQFAINENEFAKTIFNLYQGGYLRAFSVGFMSNKVDVVNEKIVLRDNELFEISSVNVPANAMALAKSKGIDIAPLEKRFMEDAQAIIEKEGRVLSAANKTKVIAARDSLNDLIAADEKKSVDIISANNSDENGRKAPTTKGGVKVKKFRAVDAMNKAVRALLKDRKIIKSV